MDKLKPILAQKFWIFFGIVLILPFVGYFMTTGELAAQIKTRMDSLETIFKGIPSGADSPNDSWSKALQALNDQQAIRNRLANEELWRDQKVKLRWPDDIAAVMNKAEYFKPVLPEQGGADLGFKYQFDYPGEIRRLWEIVDPLDDGKNLRDSDKRRKVAFAMSDLHQTNTLRWAELPPTHEDMWDCQEDIWLQTELLQAIARVNANSISQGDAFVKQLGKVQLFGATKAAGGAAAAPSPGAGAAAEAGFGPGMGMGMGMGGGGQPNKSAAITVDINLAEEFSLIPDTTVLTGSGGGEAGGGMSNKSFMGEGYPGSQPAAGATTATTAGKPDNKRYIDLDETQPYKRRGFYIKVVMDHTKVPDLIAELMNSPFPVEIVRVQQVWLSDSATPSGGGAASPYGGPGPGGFTSLNPMGGGDAAAGNAAIADDSNSGASGTFTRPGASGTTSQSAMSDPNLAHVAILGVWTLYRPPAPAADAGQSAPATAAPMPDVAAAPPAATQPSEATTAETKPAAAETTEANSDEPKKPDNSETPKSEPAKPENKESDQEKEADKDKPAEKSPAPQEPSEKPTTEPKS